MGTTTTSVRTLLLLQIKNVASRPFSSASAQSEIYKRALKLQRPTTVKYHQTLHNSVSLIGAIQLPLKQCKTTTIKGFGVHTLLRVSKASNSPHHRCYFSVMLKFWDEMAEISLQHLKPRDFVYVSGHLGSYAKVDGDGKSKHTHNYEVNVLEINFVAQHGPGPDNQNSVQLESQVSYEDNMQRRRTRLHLWHIFFSSPYEWWDNRNCKLHPNSPDFAHKDTGEKLWLKDTDPPWIKQQLQLHDSRLGKQNHGESGKDWLYLSPMMYDDAKRP